MRKMDFPEYARDFFDRQVKVIDAFRRSDSAKMARNIIRNPDERDFEDRKLSSTTRKVFRLDGFDLERETVHSILKVKGNRLNMTPHVFEAAFFSLITPYGIGPKFYFVVRTGALHGVVTEDFSEDGRYEVDEYTTNGRLSFLDREKLMSAGMSHFPHLANVYGAFSDEEAIRLLRRGTHGDEYRAFATSSFLVHDGKELKRLVCGDVDQFAEPLSDLDLSDLTIKYDFVLDLDK